MLVGVKHCDHVLGVWAFFMRYINKKSCIHLFILFHEVSVLFKQSARDTSVYIYMYEVMGN